MPKNRTSHLRKSSVRGRYRRQRNRSVEKRSGFTLVELMVAVLLVVLLMLMYATVFDQAATAINIQKAIGKNDDRSRMLSIVIKDDLNRRTFQKVIPFDPSQLISGTTPPDWPNQRGYFSISENNPANNTDDVLAFTTRIKPDDKESFYLGKATFLKYAVLSSPPQPNLFVDQPEADDGLLPLGIDTTGDGILDQLVPKNLNQMGASSAAEVVYFLRNGTLYRRVQLIRDPYSSATLDPPMITGDFVGGDLIGVTLDPNDPVRDAYLKNGSFWSHFDYSADFNRFETPGPGKARFHGVSGYLSNEPLQSTTFPVAIRDPLGALLVTETWPRSSGVPYLRFGNSLSNVDDVVDVAAGETIGANSNPQPREFVTSPGPDGTLGNADDENLFIGRFTMQETSHSQFGYPGFIPVGGDPHSRVFNFPAMTNGVVTAYGNEPLDRRRGEDILLNNVHSFDIKVWDDGLAVPGWVNLGHGGGGFYGSPTPSASLPPQPQKFANRYDTWTPFNSPHIGGPTYRPVADPIGDLSNGSPNVLRLKAIQITIRFLDEASGKMRQLTIQHALKTKK